MSSPPNNVLFLDYSIGSNLLCSKMRDIPHKQKFETITKPIFEFYLGKSDESIYEDIFTPFLSTKYKFNTENSSRFKLQFDLQRDKSFIIDQILDLPLNSIKTLTGELGLWKDRSFVLTALDYQLDIIKFAGLFNNDREVMMAAVREFPNSLLFASNELLDDVEFIKFAILNGVDLRYVPERFKKDRELVMTAIKAVGNNYFAIDETLTNDKEIVMIALEENPTIFTTLSRTLQSDREIILKTVSNFTNLNDYSELQSRILISKLESCVTEYSLDRDFAFQILSKNGDFYRRFSRTLQTDREIVMEAVKNGMNKIVLEFVPEEFTHDKEIVKLAVMNNGNSLKLAAKKLKRDKEIVLEAVKSNKGDAFQFIPVELKNDREFLKQFFSIEIYWKLVTHITENRDRITSRFVSELLQDPDIFPSKLSSMLLDPNQLIKTYSEIAKDDYNLASNYPYLSNEFKDDREILLRVVRLQKDSIKHASERLRNDREIILQVINENCYSYSSLPYKFRKDRQIALQAAMKGDVLSDIPRKMLRQDRAIALELVKRNWPNLGLLCSKFRHDREIVLEALRQDRKAFKFVPYQLRESLKVSNN